MGRPRGNPLDQAALGYPGKRKSKTEKAIAEAERLARLLVAAPTAENAGDLAPPFLEDPRLAPALAIWREYAPRLDRLHLLARLDRNTFALFCIYAAEFVAANEDVLANGYSTRVKTVSGGYMPRENPSVARRDYAAKMILDLSVRFGLSPADRNKLLRDNAMRFDEETLFGRTSSAADEAPELEAPAPAPTTVADQGAIGSLAQFDSVPPGVKPN